MTPTEILKNEHRLILGVVDAAEREVQEMRRSGRADADRVSKMLDFFRNFTDRCHHAKEEKNLFVKMEQRGMSAEGGPIWVMMQEHEDGRSHLKAAAEVVDRAASGHDQSVRTLSEHLEAYVRLLRAHIDKEDNVLYPMADRMLTREDQRELLDSFECVEREEMGEGAHERFHALAEELIGHGH